MGTRWWIAAAALIGMTQLGLGGIDRAEAAMITYSGVVLSVDQAAGKIVVGDMGPMLKGGKSEVARRTVHVASSTAYVRVTRAPGVAPSGWFGDYVETSMAAANVKSGDWVTVTVDRSTAVKVTVVDQSEP